MRRALRVNAWSSFVLSLILLAANVCAPFRTSTVGRTFLDGQCRDFAAGTWLRVRAITHADVAHGFRAVVGVSGADPDALDPEASAHPYPATPIRPSLALAVRQARLPAERPSCPLRC